ncbi:DUF2934 domain-containing protein [Cypionkella sp.]|uniref:DUF2934 domain-containing protein n=1 Tax=Cypionkella sp. TaxID=2811411 RepID=UPI0026395DBC|nr:DUF2934 domain-containing protein [Cypionkella sp.]MDB5667042.1 hypothetical protein [Cypionkella sp.]
MNREEFEALEARIEGRAVRLWSEAGSPDGGHMRFLDQARELVAIEEVDPPTLDIEDAAQPIIEEAAIQSNLGEFPTLRDQGDEMTFPDPALDDDPYAEDDIRLSDGDASETGGVLPEEDVPEDDLPEVSLADADITASALDANDDPPNEDLNDDGLPDADDFDDEELDDDALTEVDIAIDPDNGATVPEGYDDNDDDDESVLNR